MATTDELTENLIDAGDNLYLDDQGNWSTVSQPERETTWSWTADGLTPIPGKTESSVTPFLEISDAYKGGVGIEGADTWQDAVRKSIEGFMRVVYSGGGESQDVREDPVFFFDEEKSGFEGSQYRLGTLQDLVQDPTIAANLGDHPFFDTGGTSGGDFYRISGGKPNRGANAFYYVPGDLAQNREAAESAVRNALKDAGGRMPSTSGDYMLTQDGLRFIGATGSMLGRDNLSYSGEIEDYDEGKSLRNSLDSLSPQEADNILSLAREDGGQLDPLLGLNALDKLLVFEDIPVGSPLEKILGPENVLNRVRGTSDEDFNDYIFKLNLAERTNDPELIKATPASVLRKFFDLPQYQLAFGNDPATIDPNASPAERFRADPGYQFAQDEGMRQIQRNSAAKGLLESGKTQRDLQTFGQGMADQNYQRWLGQNMGMYGDWQNQLRGIASQGAGLSSQLAQQTSGLGSSSAGLQAQLASNLGSLFGNQGVLGASGFLNTGSAQANTVMQAAALQAQVAAAGGGGGGSGGGGGGGGFGSILGAMGGGGGGGGLGGLF